MVLGYDVGRRRGCHCRNVTLPLSDVLIVERSAAWRREVEHALASDGATVRWAATVQGVSRALASGAADAVLIDLDLFRPADRLTVIERLTHASPAPAVVAWAKEVSVQEAFELGRLGVRQFRRSRPDPARAVRMLTRALEMRPVLEPRLRAMVGHATQSEMIQIVRDVILDQALGATRGNKTKAGELLRVSRQAVASRSREPIEEAS